MKHFLFLLSLMLVFSLSATAQCCSAGGGSPIAGESAQGVLLERQLEFNAIYQLNSTHKFLQGDSPDKNFLERYYSHYSYLRAAYGIVKRITFSVEAGYYFDKTQIGLGHEDKISTKGWGDLILFPRFNLLNKSLLTSKTEITMGVGFKIPLGNEKDSVTKIEPFSGMEYSYLKPPAIRTTTGSNDVIFSLFLLRGFPMNNFRLFTNALYIYKGWNSLGEKAGDYASISLFASKTLFEKLGVTLQVKGEWIDKMKVNDPLNMNGFYNYDPAATGSKKITITPQLGYSWKSYAFFILSEFPLYQYVNKQQIASQYALTAGLSYKFLVKKKEVEKSVK